MFSLSIQNRVTNFILITNKESIGVVITASYNTVNNKDLKLF